MIDITYSFFFTHTSILESKQIALLFFLIDERIVWKFPLDPCHEFDSLPNDQFNYSRLEAEVDHLDQSRPRFVDMGVGNNYGYVSRSTS